MKTVRHTTSMRKANAAKTAAGSALSQRPSSTRAAAGWKIPRGRSLDTVTKKATGQVISRYGETLRKLKSH